MGGVAAVGAGYDVAAGSRRAPRTAMTQGTAVGQSRANDQIGVDVAESVAFIRSLVLRLSELPLE